jgi:hypothetical protein
MAHLSFIILHFPPLCYNRRVPLEKSVSESVRAQISVRGVVQGVNFRWFAQRRASELSLNGFARNLPDARMSS